MHIQRLTPRGAWGQLPTKRVCYNTYMALAHVVPNTKASSMRRSHAKRAPVGTVENTFTVQDAYIYELLNNKIDNVQDVLKAEIASNRDAIGLLRTELKAEIASNRDALKAEIASNRELFLAHFKSMENQFKTVRWALGLIFVFIFGIATKLFFF